MAAELATSENEAIEHAATPTAPGLSQPFTVKEETFTDTAPELSQLFTVKEETFTEYPDMNPDEYSSLSYCDSLTVKAEPDWTITCSPVPYSVQKRLKVEIEDEVTVEDHDMEGQLYAESDDLPLSQVMEGGTNDINPDIFLGSKLQQEGQITCFVDVDTLKTANLFCDEVFSDPLLGEVEDLETEVKIEEDKSAHVVNKQPVLRRSGRTKRWEILKTELKAQNGDMEDQLPEVFSSKTIYEIPQAVLCQSLAELLGKGGSEGQGNTSKEGIDNIVMQGNLSNMLPKSDGTYRKVRSGQDNVRMRTMTKRLTWMRQQKQKVERHILEVRTQKALEEKRKFKLESVGNKFEAEIDITYKEKLPTEKQVKQNVSTRLPSLMQDYQEIQGKLSNLHMVLTESCGAQDEKIKQQNEEEELGKHQVEESNEVEMQVNHKKLHLKMAVESLTEKRRQKERDRLRKRKIRASQTKEELELQRGRMMLNMRKIWKSQTQEECELQKKEVKLHVKSVKRQIGIQKKREKAKLNIRQARAFMLQQELKLQKENVKSHMRTVRAVLTENKLQMKM